MTIEDLDRKDKDSIRKFNNYVIEECKRQWKEDNEETYGDWDSQSANTRTKYYNRMYERKIVEMFMECMGFES